MGDNDSKVECKRCGILRISSTVDPDTNICLVCKQGRTGNSWYGLLFGGLPILFMAMYAHFYFIEYENLRESSVKLNWDENRESGKLDWRVGIFYLIGGKGLIIYGLAAIASCVSFAGILMLFKENCKSMVFGGFLLLFGGCVYDLFFVSQWILDQANGLYWTAAILHFIFDTNLVVFYVNLIGLLLCLSGILNLFFLRKQKDNSNKGQVASEFSYMPISDNESTYYQEKISKDIIKDNGLKEAYLLSIKYEGENITRPLLCIKSDTRYEDLMRMFKDESPELLRTLDIVFYRYLKLKDRELLHDVCVPFYVKQ